ncbi:hypothetical protein PGT21_022308 [Puccinia graminis f. sp. tritici]|uniref:Uncharacterized protein n=1 Tax=Puccinia graminis f. sp. tritici TaxID=56615 RepID=A0A5B0P132_PUCGR|nr:hypothetical protein PGT21_022308 [Puccinia graminis f. sp. tritici]KAA1129124.1 hypothetical protein PGTUg99_030552 [Puccinia graminis f. sp. tritici]
MIMRSKFSLLGYSTVCLFAFGIALARPALLDSDSESLFATDRNSNTGDLFEVFNRGSLLGHKRLQELQSEPCQPAQSGVEAHCADFATQNEYKDGNPAHFFVSNGAKRQKTVLAAHHGTSSHSSLGVEYSTDAVPHRTFLTPGIPDGMDNHMNGLEIHSNTQQNQIDQEYQKFFSFFQTMASDTPLQYYDHSNYAGRENTHFGTQNSMFGPAEHNDLNDIQWFGTNGTCRNTQTWLFQQKITFNLSIFLQLKITKNITIHHL